MELSKKELIDICNMSYNEWTPTNKWNFFEEKLKAQDKIFKWPVNIPEEVTKWKETHHAESKTMGRLKYLERDAEIMQLEEETKLERIENELLIKIVLVS